MATSISKQNARQHAKRKGYYERQYDKTKINKTIAMVRHLAHYGMKGLEILDKGTADKIKDENRHHLTLVRNKLKAVGASRLLYTLDDIRA